MCDYFHRYGLIKSTPKSQPSALKPSVFNNDSSSDDEAPKESWGKAALKVRMAYDSAKYMPVAL